MQITIDDLIVITKDLLLFLDERDITKLTDVEKLVGREFPRTAPYFVKVEMRESNFGTQACTLSYISPNAVGIPIETKSNRVMGYTYIFLKADQELPGYESFALDHYHNVIQAKLVNTVEWSSVRKELENILEMDTPTHRH
jgi:hypothetical protein